MKVIWNQTFEQSSQRQFDTDHRTRYDYVSILYLGYPFLRIHGQKSFREKKGTRKKTQSFP